MREAHLDRSFTWPDSSPRQRSGARTSASSGYKSLLGLRRGQVPGLADLGQENNAKNQLRNQADL